MTRWEVTIAQALSDAGYATGMWGKWHLGSDPGNRSPVDFGFDEAVWSPRTADEVLWTMQSYFPDGSLSATPYAGDTEVTVDPDPFGGQRRGSSGPWRGGLFTSLEGSNRTPCIVRWPGNVPAGKVSNELVHEVDWFTTLLLAAGAEVPGDRMIDSMNMRTFLLGEAEHSGRDAILCFQGTRLQAVKWGQWKAHLFKQDEFMSTWSAYNLPHIHNLEWDPREENEVGFPHAWVAHPMAAAAGAFLKSLAAEPPIKPGTPDPYSPPQPGELRPEEHLQIGPITQYVTSLTKSHDEPPESHHGLDHATG